MQLGVGDSETHLALTIPIVAEVASTCELGILVKTLGMTMRLEKYLAKPVEKSGSCEMQQL